MAYRHLITDLPTTPHKDTEKAQTRALSVSGGRRNNLYNGDKLKPTL